MRRPQNPIRQFLMLRRSTNLKVRVGFWVTTVLLVGTALFYPQPRAALIASWITWNLCYTVAAVTWSLFHIRTILRAREAGLSWAVWLTLISTLLIFSTLYSRSLEWQGPSAASSNVTTVLIGVLTVLLCPVLFITILGIGWIGGAVGAFSSRRTGDVEAAVHSVVRSLFAVIVFMGLAAGLGRGHGETYVLLCFSLPLLAVGLHRLPPRLVNPMIDRIRRSSHLLEHLLQWRITLRGRVHVLDLRGFATGLCAACVMLATPAPLIVPFKTLGLVTLIQARSAASTFFTAVGGRVHLGQAVDSNLDASRSRIVILDMDTSVRDRILHGTGRTQTQPSRSESATTTNLKAFPKQAAKPPPSTASTATATVSNAQSDSWPSESRVQTQIISQVKRWDAARIVLPTPTLHRAGYWPVQGQPAPDEAEIERARSDTRLLAAAMQAAGNVVLMLPPNRTRQAGNTDQEPTPEAFVLKDAKQQRLMHAARAVGLSDPSWSSTAHLPMVPAHWRRYVPIPVLLSAEQTGRTVDLQPTAHEFDLSRIAGIHMHQIAPEGVLINFVGLGPQRDFVHISYSTLLKDEPIYVDLPGETPLWTTPHEYLRGRTVFLDSLSGTMHPTPMGAMPRPEIMAYGTATLLSGDSIRRVGAITTLLLPFLVGAIIGASCFRRAPIDALWRAAIPLTTIPVLSLVLFMFRGYWLDPVEPLGAGLLSLGFVSQFTFRKERAEQERTRALFQRFVAPQMVDELLSRPGETLGLGGKRQTVCVLFADVRNFTGFTERNEADKVIEVINIYMGALTEALHRFGGILDKYTGDGLMAWFPVGKDAAADVGTAVTACLAMRDAAIEASTRMSPAERLEIGFGMHYGDAVVGLVGCEDLQVNWTALGYTVVVSARLQTIAAGGEVVISEQVNQITAGAFYVEEGEPVKVKGLTAPVRPYRVISGIRTFEPVNAVAPAAPAADQQVGVGDPSART